MAKAPTPGGAGTTGGKEKVEAASEVMRIRVRDETRELRPGMLTLKDRFALRMSTGGLPIEAFLGQVAFGEDSLMVLWWLAGRQAGEAKTLAQVEADWPQGLGLDDIDLERETPDDDEGGADPQP